MYIPFNTLPPSASIWIYQADKKLSPSTIDILRARLRSFTDQWLVHGAPLEASFEIFYDQFVVLGANDTASGCSIDSSVRTMKELGHELQVNFFDRGMVAFMIGQTVSFYPFGKLKQLFSDRTLRPDSLVFNNSITTLKELREGWPAPAEKTWIRRYFTNESVVNDA